MDRFADLILRHRGLTFVLVVPRVCKVRSLARRIPVLAMII